MPPKPLPCPEFVLITLVVPVTPFTILSHGDDGDNEEKRDVWLCEKMDVGGGKTFLVLFV